MNQTGELSTPSQSPECSISIPDNKTDTNNTTNYHPTPTLHNRQQVIAEIPPTPFNQRCSQTQAHDAPRIVQRAPAATARGNSQRRSTIVQSRGIQKGASNRRAAQRRNKGRSLGGRGAGFTQAEVDYLLELIEEHLPLCKDEWDFVLADFMKRYPEADRNVDSLKRKFSSLHRQRIPTGDPQIPPATLKAKAIRHKMTERADMGTGEELGDMC